MQRKQQDNPYSDLGTKEIHQRHSVMIEGGLLPRARVMDQTLADRFLMGGLITLEQHQAAEYFLEQAHRAGVFLKSPRLDGLPSGGARRDGCSNGLLQYSRTLRLVTRALSEQHAQVLSDVVLQDQAVDELTLSAFLLPALDLIVERRLSGGRNPLRHLD